MEYIDMVMEFGTPENVARELDMARRGKRDAEEMTNFQRDHVGREKARLEVPIIDRHQMRQAIRMIRGWCDNAEFVLEQWDENTPIHYHLGGIRMSLKVLNNKLRTIKPAGRPKKDTDADQ